MQSRSTQFRKCFKQSYEYVGRRLLMKSSRYAPARQMKQVRASTRKLKRAESSSRLPSLIQRPADNGQD
jgi:hypothetical protein